MKNRIIFLSLFLAALIIIGCKPKQALSNNNIVADTNANDQKIKALGTPKYEKVTAKGFEILPFPGLEYNGIRDGKQAFYAANKDYSFAIYTDQGITNSSMSFEEVILYYEKFYEAYAPTCKEVPTVGWITKARAFSCRYYITSIDANYKSTVFYREGDYVETIVGVWGTALKEYEYIFDAFDAQAIRWT